MELRQRCLALLRQTEPAEKAAATRELFGAIVACPGIAGFCYTQLTDTEQETNGLLTEAREPKFDVAAINAIVSMPIAY